MKLSEIIEPVKLLLKRLRRKPTGDVVRRKRYQVAITNLSSRRQVAQVRGRKGNLLLLAAFTVFALWGVLTLLLIFTPLRAILPPRMTTDLRDKYEELAIKADSVTSAARLHEQYVRNVMSILGDTVPNTADAPQQATTLPIDSLMEATETERSFVQRFEADERYNVSVLSPIAAEGMAFYPPTWGLEVEERTSDSGIPYVQAAPGKDSPVSAIYRGTVINTYYTTGRGSTVVIQHPNGFISQYSGLSHLFVTRGDKVAAGSRIGLASDKMGHLVFELWHNGSPLPPTQYVKFQ